jgi:hypothetical protein
LIKPECSSPHAIRPPQCTKSCSQLNSLFA